MKIDYTAKARYWSAIMYPENMIDSWKDDISQLLEFPYAYCIHDKDLNGERKTHVHIILALPNTTTFKAVVSLFVRLQKDGFCAFPYHEEHAIAIRNIRQAYAYLIHDTEDSRCKYRYDESERVCGNNFDIGLYEQLSVAEKEKYLQALAGVILDEGYDNFAVFSKYIRDNYEPEIFRIVSSNSAFLERLTRANYQLNQKSKHS